MSPIDPSKISKQHSNSTSKVPNVNDDELENITIPGTNNSGPSNIKMPGGNVLSSVGGYLNNNDQKNHISGNDNGNESNYFSPNMFNNNHGIMSINIEHKHIYGGRTVFDNNKKVNRKIEFTNKEFNNAPMSTLTESENFNSSRNYLAKSSNFKGRNNNSLKKYENDIEDRASSKDITVDDIPIDSETLVKPQPIVRRRFTKLNDDIMNQGSIYINPIYQIQDSSSYSQIHQPIFYPSCNLIPAYQIKIQEEAKKKKFSCSCKRSKCLKLYCECFANGEFCMINCNCNDCSNVIGNEPEREVALKLIKDKNPIAIKLQSIKEEEENEAKIGCNCTKSNCSKKYCECYKANLKCSEICRCRDCGNSSERLKQSRLKSSFQKDFSKSDNLNNQIYIYDDFSVEKISVLIENKKIFITSKSYKDSEKLKFLEEKTSSDKSEYIAYQGDDVCDYENKTNISTELVVKREQNSILIEIPKRILNLDKLVDVENSSLGLIQTPNKFRKRNRRSSLDSYKNTNNVSVSDYNKFTKTACETSKKINLLTKIPNNIGKKLILDDVIGN